MKKPKKKIEEIDTSAQVADIFFAQLHNKCIWTERCYV